MAAAAYHAAYAPNTHDRAPDALRCLDDPVFDERLRCPVVSYDFSTTLSGAPRCLAMLDALHAAACEGVGGHP